MRPSCLVSRHRAGFTLVELMVSMAILVLLLLVIVSITDATRKTWAYTSSKIEEFGNAREAFESITRKLSQATLNTYWDYHYPAGNSTPDRYIRQSELRFISGNGQTLTGSSSVTTHAVFFQAPLGYVTGANYSNLENLINTWGYFVEFGDDSQARPAFLNNIVQVRKRFRIKELMEPSESLTLYTYTSGTNASGQSKNSVYTGTEWFTTPFNGTAPYTTLTRPVRTLAENVIALVLLPKLAPQEEQSLQTSGEIPSAPQGTSLAPQYTYDSTVAVANAALNTKNQLPPVIQVTMVAIDETSANRMTDSDNANLQAKLGTLFIDATKCAADLNRDPANVADPSLETYLITHRINYRIFTTNISIKSAKWSRAESN